MTPLSFDPKTAREFIGDEAARRIEQRARTDADAQEFTPPAVEGDSYASQVAAQMRAVVYREQFFKRTARNERKLIANWSS